MSEPTTNTKTTNDADETECDHLEAESGPDEYRAPYSWWAGQPNPNATEHNPEGL